MFKKPLWWPTNEAEARELKQRHDEAWSSGKVCRVFKIEKYMPLIKYMILSFITALILVVFIADTVLRIYALFVCSLLLVMFFKPKLPSSDENLVRALIDTENRLSLPLIIEELDYLARIYPDIWGEDIENPNS